MSICLRIEIHTPKLDKFPEYDEAELAVVSIRTAGMQRTDGCIPFKGTPAVETPRLFFSLPRNAQQHPGIHGMHEVTTSYTKRRTHRIVV